MNAELAKPAEQERNHESDETDPDRVATGIAATTRTGERRYVFMIVLPALRLLTRPLPPLAFAARAFAAVIRPPRVFFMGVSSRES